MMSTPIIDLALSPVLAASRPSGSTSTSHSSSSKSTSSASRSRKRTRPAEDTSTETCQTCEGSGRVAKKKKKGAKKNPEPSRWPQINLRRPDLKFQNTKIEYYDCGGLVFEAKGKTVEDRLDALEEYLEECSEDESTDSYYGYA